MSRLLALFAFSLLGGCCMAAGVVPPSRTEVGSIVVPGHSGPAAGLRVATGVHLASGRSRDDAELDIGAGYVFERMGAGTTTPPADDGAVALSTAPTPTEDRAAFLDAHGAYLDVARVVERRDLRRTWAGVRGEVLVQRDGDTLRRVDGAYARVAVELFTAGQGAGGGSDSRGIGAGFYHGTVAMGAYLEAGMRHVEDEKAAFVAIGGLSMRLPLLGGMAIGWR